MKKQTTHRPARYPFEWLIETFNDIDKELTS